ncbi:hypothetical protein ACP70R_001793 [Stipagrostis hirtigluma subsp. patula]
MGRAPVLERMSNLALATVSVRNVSAHHCSHADYGGCDDGDCGGCVQEENDCVLLQGLSQARSLGLRAGAEMFIFRRDSKWCPTFRQLKFLALNLGWSVPDLHMLACILEHSPVLETHASNVEMKGVFNPKELPSTMSTHLKRVEVCCEVVDERVLKVLKFLSRRNIAFRVEE